MAKELKCNEGYNCGCVQNCYLICLEKSGHAGWYYQVKKNLNCNISYISKKCSRYSDIIYLQYGVKQGMEVEFAPNTNEVVNLPGDCHCGPGTTTQEPPPTTPPGNMRYKS